MNFMYEKFSELNLLVFDIKWVKKTWDNHHGYQSDLYIDPCIWQVTRESGPPHLKNFVTQCNVGSFKTEAEGNSKKLSKKRAAELMLKELKALPTLTVTSIRPPKPKPAVNKKKSRNLIKVGLKIGIVIILSTALVSA